jgi:hypothetical protein
MRLGAGNFTVETMNFRNANAEEQNASMGRQAKFLIQQK